MSPHVLFVLARYLQNRLLGKQEHGRTKERINVEDPVMTLDQDGEAQYIVAEQLQALGKEMDNRGEQRCTVRTYGCWDFLNLGPFAS